MGILGFFLPGKEDIYTDGALGSGDPVSSHSFSHGSSSSVIVLGYREGLLHSAEGSGGTGLNMRGLSWGTIYLACLDGTPNFVPVSLAFCPK